jgi:hypothetical protein
MSAAVAMKEDELIWSFGYGSNMDVASVESKKNIKVLGELDFSESYGGHALLPNTYVLYVYSQTISPPC